MDPTAKSSVGIEDDDDEVAGGDWSVTADATAAAETAEEAEKEAGDGEDGTASGEVCFIASLGFVTLCFRFDQYFYQGEGRRRERLICG